MSALAIRNTLEAALAALSPALATAWEGVEYEPTVGTPFQSVFVLMADPDNIEMGPGYIERGFLQVNLNYPNGGGAREATNRAEVIRAAFPFASTFDAGGNRLLISATPAIGPARIEADRYILPVRIPFECHVRGV